ncbi:MAG: PilZ domain-containing protein [Bryobacteraceae bacterium]
MSEFRGNVERRQTNRFPLRETLRYRLLNPKGDPVGGFGQTLNMGSGGILFTTEELLPVGRSVELAVDWPAQLNGNCPLKFVAVGRVVRSTQSQAAVRIERYQFKTRGRAPLVMTAALASSA